MRSLAGGIYPERAAPEEGPVDRLLAWLGYRLQQRFARTLGDAGALAAEVARHAVHERSALAGRVPALRYRLRRDGFPDSHLGECFGLYCAALGKRRLEARVFAAARWIVSGGVAELADAGERRAALALAVAAQALRGAHVHVLCASDGAARSLADELGAPLGVLGLRVGCVTRGQNAHARRESYGCAVVCGFHREIGRDYLRDRLLAGGPPGALRQALERLAASGVADDALALRGLHCALVDDADAVLLDDAQAPLVIAAQGDAPPERLVHEQAFELARGLAPDADFTLEGGAVRLAPAAGRLLEELVGPLGGLWANRPQREALVCLALKALHVLEPNIDYRVEGGRVHLPEAPDADSVSQEELKSLLEVKERARVAGPTQVLARMSVPRFFGRYVELAGACADARGAEDAFWGLYGLRAARAGEPPADVPQTSRLFLTAAAKASALVQAVRAARGAGHEVVVCVRSPVEAAAAREAVGEVAITVVPAMPEAPAGGAPVSVLVAELPDTRRHIEKACRSAGASRCQVLLSLEDEAVRSRVAPWLAAACRAFCDASGELSPRWSGWVIRLAQSEAQRSHGAAIRELKAADRALDDLLAVSGQRE